MKLQWGLKRARTKGLFIVQPKETELQIDLDGVRALRAYGMQYSILRRAGLCTGWRERITQSKKRGHTHVTITMPGPMSLLKRVCLQAILGSDLKREAFNLCRVLKRNKYPIVFFESGKHAHATKR